MTVRKSSKTPNLNDIDSAVSFIQRRFDEAVALGGERYDKPNAVLRRAIYRVGQRYEDARQTAILEKYARNIEWEELRSSSNVYRWILKILSHDSNIDVLKAKSNRSKMERELFVALKYDIHVVYLDHFLAVIGGYAGARRLQKEGFSNAPKWVKGITRAKQNDNFKASNT